jgi:hypothetical protein
MGVIYTKETKETKTFVLRPPPLPSSLVLSLSLPPFLANQA